MKPAIFILEQWSSGWLGRLGWQCLMVWAELNCKKSVKSRTKWSLWPTVYCLETRKFDLKWMTNPFLQPGNITGGHKIDKVMLWPIFVTKGRSGSVEFSKHLIWQRWWWQQQWWWQQKWWWQKNDDDNNDDDNNDDGEACKSLLRPFCISTVVPGTSLLFCSAAGVWPWECS